MKKLLFLLIVIATFLAISGTALAAPLIVLDPGHSGGKLLSTDYIFTPLGMTDWEYDNGTENHEMWAVCLKLKAKLEAAGYQVLLTKDGPDDIVSKRERVNFSNNNNAALFLSIHRAGYTFGTYGGVYDQRTTLWRAAKDGTRCYFKLPEVAARSTVIAKAIITARRVYEGSSITLKVNTYTGRGGNIPDGNLTITQLWNTQPALLLEAGICNTTTKQDKYAQGVFNGIKASIPVDGSVVVTPPPPVNTTQVGTVVNCNYAVNVRSGPSTSYSIIGTAPKGATYPVITKTGSWYKILYKGRTGYIYYTYLRVVTQ
jgi:hypothetical protein